LAVLRLTTVLFNCTYTRARAHTHTHTHTYSDVIT